MGSLLFASERSQALGNRSELETSNSGRARRESFNQIGSAVHVAPVDTYKRSLQEMAMYKKRPVDDFSSTGP